MQFILIQRRAKPKSTKDEVKSDSGKSAEQVSTHSEPEEEERSKPRKKKTGLFQNIKNIILKHKLNIATYFEI